MKDQMIVYDFGGLGQDITSDATSKDNCYGCDCCDAPMFPDDIEDEDMDKKEFKSLSDVFGTYKKSVMSQPKIRREESTDRKLFSKNKTYVSYSFVLYVNEVLLKAVHIMPDDTYQISSKIRFKEKIYPMDNASAKLVFKEAESMYIAQEKTRKQKEEEAIKHDTEITRYNFYKNLVMHLRSNGRPGRAHW